MSIFKRGTVELEQPNTPAPNEPLWMKVVHGELGVKEVPGSGDNPRIVEYHAETELHASKDAIAWCSSFANWVMKQVGIKGTRSAAALSWRSWGTKLSQPKYGCIVVFDHGGGHGHVTFFEKWDGSYLVCTGGNQSDSVRTSKYSTGEVVAYRWPA